MPKQLDLSNPVAVLDHYEDCTDKHMHAYFQANAMDRAAAFATYKRKVRGAYLLYRNRQNQILKTLPEDQRAKFVEQFLTAC